MKSNKKLRADSLSEALTNGGQLFVHLLSPIEREAIKQKYSVFEYRLNDINIRITPQICKQLRELSLIKINLFAKNFGENALYLIGKVEKVLLFLDTPIEYYHFPTRLYRNLKAMGCHTMRHVLEQGRNRVKRSYGIGKVGMQIIDELLKKHDCDFLFSK